MTGIARYRIEVLAAIAALAITILFLNRSFSGLDDGFYMWVTQRLMAGARLHADISVLHPGYAFYLDAALIRAFGPDYLSLRYPLPILSATITVALVHLARPAGTVTQAVVGVGAIALGVVQFVTPSSSWYAVAACVVAAASFHRALSIEDRRTRHNWLFVAGILLGVAAGFRQTNGAFVAAGLIFAHSMISKPSPTIPSRFEQGVAALSILLATALVAIPAIGSNSPSSWTLTLPSLLCALLAANRFRRDIGSRNIRWASPIAIGCFFGFLPALSLATTHGGLTIFMQEVFLRSAAYSTYSQSLGISYNGMLVDAVEVLSKGSVFAIFNGIYLAVVALLPIAFSALIVVNRARLSSPHIGVTVVLGSVFLLNQISFQGLLYSFFWLPAVVTALLLLSSRSRYQTLAITTVSAFSLLALFFHAGRLPGAPQLEIMTNPHAQQVRCPLPRCSLWAHPAAVMAIRADYEDLAKHVPHDKPLLVLPVGVPLYVSLPHPSPWNTGGIFDGVTSSHELSVLDHLVKTTPDAVIAVSRSYELAATRPRSADVLIGSLCFTSQIDRFRLYRSCPDRK